MVAKISQLFVPFKNNYEEVNDYHACPRHDCGRFSTAKQE